jgi:hypothetical protein
MRMNSADNEALRLKGWSVFRSASRDHLIPLTGSGAALQRIKVAAALPAAGTFEGVALDLSERQARAEQRSLNSAAAERQAVGRPLGVTQYMVFSTDSQGGNPSAIATLDVFTVIGIAPFDGFVTELFLETLSAVTPLGIAIRSSGGATLFRSQGTANSFPTDAEIAPDFISPGGFNVSPAKVTLRNLKMPVFAGEEIIVVARLAPLAAPNLGAVYGVLGFESFILARPGSVAEVSAFGALTVEARRAATEAAANATRVALSREQTARADIAARAQIEVAKTNAEAHRPASQPGFNPFQPLLLSESALTQLASRSPTPAPRPRVSSPPATPPAGEGQTFVSAWNPSFGSIGYLIPDPPRGGRVNVFDNTYTIWDVSGRNVGSGAIIPVASDGDIPPGARISPVRGGVPPSGLTPATGPRSTQF